MLDASLGPKAETRAASRAKADDAEHRDVHHARTITSTKDTAARHFERTYGSERGARALLTCHVLASEPRDARDACGVSVGDGARTMTSIAKQGGAMELWNSWGQLGALQPRCVRGDDSSR